MGTIKELVKAALRDVQAAVREYLQEATEQAKLRLKKILVLSVAGAVLVTVAASMFGSAALFLLLGNYKYLRLSLPAWQAWTVIGVEAAITGAVLLVILYFIIRRQLRPSKSPSEPAAA